MREHCSEIYRFIVIALRGLENLFVIGPANFFLSLYRYRTSGKFIDAHQ